MKTELPGLHLVSFVALMGTIACIVLGGPVWISLAFAITSMVGTALTIRLWLKYVKVLLVESDTLLDKREKTITWSFRNLSRLKKNQEEASKKFQTSATMISNLTQPEKIVVTNEADFKDPIGKALLTIKSEMQQIKEEGEKRSWITQGIAGFGEVLRNKLEVKEYGYQIISYLIKYVKANQGRFFIEQENTDRERCLELIASYAYGKRKYSEDVIVAGQGVLGQNMLEKDFVFMTAIPDSYVKITSGLGEATPRNIVIAPLIFNDIYCGAIELASFHVLEPHHLEFLRRVCEDIASEIMALRTMGRTQGLLDEARNLTLELQSREEEMKLKQTELSGIINAIDSTLATAEFDSQGRLIKHNDILEKFTQYNDTALSGKDYSLLTGSRDSRTWERIWAGEIRSGDFKTLSASNTELWFSVTFTPITDEDNYSIKLLCLIQDITQKKVKEIEFSRLSIVANNTDNSVIITDNKGFIEYVNTGFTKMTGYLPNEVTGKKPGAFLQGELTEKKTIKKLSEQIAAGIPTNEEILNYTKSGDTYWVSLAINPVRDDSGSIVQYISIQTDITHTKIKSLDFNQKLEALSRSNAIIEMDRYGILIDINDNYLKMFGYKRDEVIGKPYSIFTRTDNAFEKLKSTVVAQGMQSGVYSRFDKSGNRYHVKLMDYPVLDMNGELEKIIEFGVDVSNEKRLEQEAERRQAELKSYLTGIDNTIATAAFNLNGNLIDANEIFLKVMGYTQDDFGKKNFEFMMGDDQALTMMWENLRLGKFFSGEYKMRNKVGKELWITGTFNPIFVSGNEPEKILMFAQFTTQEKEKVNDLTGMVNALKSTLPVFEFNQHFSCKTANEKAMKIFGLSRMELRSKKLEDFIAPHYHGLWDQYKDEVLRTDVAHFIIPFVVDGQTANYEVSMSVIKNLEGEIGKVIVLLVKEVQEKVSVMKAV